MSELRQDSTTFDWIIIAKERARRPHEFMVYKGKPHIPEYEKDCPFCPGNEEKTPDATAVYGTPDRWRIRVVPNKFAALTPDGDTTKEERSLFRKTHGYGMHEVVIETAMHNQSIPFMNDDHVQELI